MSNQQVNYNPGSLSNMSSMQVNQPDDALMYLMAGIVPKNLFAQNESFRDALIGMIIQMYPDKQQTILDVFIRILQTDPSTTERDVKGAAEYLATLSFAWGDKELATNTLLRIDPSVAAGLLHTIYLAMSERQMDSNTFKQMLVQVKDRALNMWKASGASAVQL